MTAPLARQDVTRLAERWALGLAPEQAVDFGDLLQELLEPLPDPPASTSAAQTTHAANDPYNALVRRCEMSSRRDGSLSGLRFALKDSIATVGLPLTCGSALLEGYVADRDSVVTERILGNGGEVVAMTNMDDLAACADGSSSAYGPTLNPVDPTRLAGGSSGGAAASLFLDDIDVTIGTDQGGSVRVPASWCGVVGLKPTHGLVPYTGVVGTDHHLDHVGVLAREVAVVRRVLHTLADIDVASDVPALASLRIGVLSEGLSAELGIEPAVREAVSALADELASAGATVAQTSVPQHTATADAETAMSCEGLISLLGGGGNAYGWQAVAWPSLSRALQAGMRSRASELSAHVKTGLLIGAWLRERFEGEHYVHAQRRCEDIRTAYDRALEDADVLLLPTTPSVAQPLSAPGSTAEVVLRGWAPMANTAQFNLSGHPAISLPLCEVAGLPLGVMLVGRRFADARLLAIAQALEQAFARPLALPRAVR